MIRITREADYGILLMTGLAQAEGQPRSAGCRCRWSAKSSKPWRGPVS